MQSVTISTADPAALRPFMAAFRKPETNSHKGQNGKALIIGGSSFFHSASLWSAEIAAHCVDMVHYSSTRENAEIFLSVKKRFQNGIIVPQRDLPTYMREDDAILIGPGMVRSDAVSIPVGDGSLSFEEIMSIRDEALYTARLVQYGMTHAPDKRWIIDAGGLQMMHADWLKHLRVMPILTPHELEFERLFGLRLRGSSPEERLRMVSETARTHRACIVLKGARDIISDGDQTCIVAGGNPGLTKGGTGDVLAGLITGLAATQEPLVATLLATYAQKRAAEILFAEQGTWYTNADLIKTIPPILREVIYN